MHTHTHTCRPASIVDSHTYTRSSQKIIITLIFRQSITHTNIHSPSPTQHPNGTPPPPTLMIKPYTHYIKTDRSTDTHTHTHTHIILSVSHKHAIIVHGYPLVSQERILLPGYICCFPPFELVSRYHSLASHTYNPYTYTCMYICMLRKRSLIHTHGVHVVMYICRSTLEPHSYALYPAG